jgi:hypothetical protein
MCLKLLLFFFYGSPAGFACGYWLGHSRWAPHHGSRVEEGELLLVGQPIVIYPWLDVVGLYVQETFFRAYLIYFILLVFWD